MYVCMNVVRSIYVRMFDYSIVLYFPSTTQFCGNFALFGRIADCSYFKIIVDS